MGQVAATFTPTPMPEILATPTPLGADKLIPEKTTNDIWQIVRQALVYAAVIIGLLLVAFLLYRIIIGRRKQKGTQ
jgi:multisubunit Na+/H+ antiporter MnhC subunit